MAKWIVRLRDSKGKAEVVKLDAANREVARAAVANWLIDRPEYRLVALESFEGAKEGATDALG